MTDKTTTNIISRVGYDGASYTHQGWVTDKNWQTTLILVSKPQWLNYIYENLSRTTA